MSTNLTLTYLRYDSTNIPPPIGIIMNFYLTIYHIDGTNFVDSAVSSDVNNWIIQNNVTRQKFITGFVLNKNLIEFDNINIALSGLDSKSAIVIFITHKTKISHSINLVDVIVDHYSIPNAKVALNTNPNLVYNTDNFYLLEMNNAIDVFSNLQPKPSSSPSGVVVMSNPIIQQQYLTIYNQILSNAIDQYINQHINTTGLTDDQIAQLKAQTLAQYLNDNNLMNQIETNAMAEFNSQYKSDFYHKYLGETNNDNVDVISKIYNNIYNIKCIQPFSTVIYYS